MCLQVDFLFRVSGKIIGIFSAFNVEIETTYFCLQCTSYGEIFVNYFYFQFHWLENIFCEINGEKNYENEERFSLCI